MTQRKPIKQWHESTGDWRIRDEVSRLTVSERVTQQRECRRLRSAKMD